MTRMDDSRTEEIRANWNGRMSERRRITSIFRARHDNILKNAQAIISVSLYRKIE
jgi:hypothetical protein